MLEDQYALFCAAVISPGPALEIEMLVPSTSSLPGRVLFCLLLNVAFDELF